MENNPRKSKALIITIIIIIFLLVIGFLLYKNRDNFRGGTSGIISKIFSPLASSKNPKDLTTLAQAGEDIHAGDNLSLSGYDENNNPIVTKAGAGANIYGFASQDILNGEFGEIIVNSPDSNGFWDSFSNFLNNLFDENNNQANLPAGGWTFNNDLGIWEFDPNSIGGWVFDPNIGGWIPPGGSGGYNPQCSDTIDNDTDNLIDNNDPNCHVGGTMDGEYLPNHYSESTNPLGGGDIDIKPKCSDTIDNDTDGFIDNLDPACHVGGDINLIYLPDHDSETDMPCENGASNPPLCTIFEKEKIPDLTAGAISPTSVLSGAQTTISAPISNIGEGGTINGFQSFFTITNQEMGGTGLSGDDNVVSKSKFKKLISKIFKKETWISMVKAATTVDVGVIINVELAVATPKIDAGDTRIITTTYNFNTPGMYYVRACADKSSIGNRGVIEETNEDNNCGPWTAINSTSSLPPPGELPKCSDGTDNDRDRLIDDLDPACHIGGDLNNVYISTHDSESTPPDAIYECNDELDNDSDNKIDINDPQCHIDGQLDKDYVAEHNSETTPPVGSGNEEENICLAVQQNPLVFTAEEESELAELLRKFYLLAPNLKSEDDISVIYDEIERKKEFINQLTDLTNQCYRQTESSDWDISPTWKPEGNLQGLGFSDGHGGYEIPLHRFGNPWFKGKDKKETEQYFDYNLVDTKLISGYFSGTTHRFEFNGKFIEEGLDCDEYFTPRPSSGYAFYTPKLIPPHIIIKDYNGWNWAGDCKDNNYPPLPQVNGGPWNEWAVCSSEAIYAGCKWNGGTTYQEVELLLNVW